MEKSLLSGTNNGSPSNNNANSCDAPLRKTSSDFLLQWGNRKRLRCMKVQAKSKDESAPFAARVDRRVVKSLKPGLTLSKANHGNGFLSLRQRSSSPRPPAPQRIQRNSESSGAMRRHSNGGPREISSPERHAHEKKGTNNTRNGRGHGDYKSVATSDTVLDGKKGGDAAAALTAAPPPTVWPPKFAIALTNKEKEEDFLVLRGSKLPQRPKKRAKVIQRTINLVSPGGWLCDLTLERYEVREKKTSKKRPRGLKAICNMESESE